MEPCKEIVEPVGKHMIYKDIFKILELLESRMFMLIPVAGADLDAFGEHLACVVCFVTLMAVKLDLHYQDIVGTLRAGK